MDEAVSNRKCVLHGVYISSSGSHTRTSVCPQPSLSRYYVNRDTLFCYHKASEAFLQRLMALYVASHYKVARLILHVTRFARTRVFNLFHRLNSFSRVPEFAQRPADAVRRSGPSPLLPPAASPPDAELPTRGPRRGPG